ncbi:MAG: glycoside hydrolase family 32 protein [Chitinophagaceae bacterium]
MKISKPYLNIPIGSDVRAKLMQLRVNGKLQREFAIQLAEDTVSYWLYVDVSEFKGEKLDINYPGSPKAIKRIYQDDKINGEDSLYKESYRPQFHFTVKRGWSNDINGPIYYNGVYHLFWQSFPFGLDFNVDYMYWGHAVSKDLLHWEELEPALYLDSLGSPWSGSTVIDKNNSAGFGANALIIFYTAFDRISKKQVQCIAYSTDNGKTFMRYKGNPIIDSNREWESNHTRDPKVLWYEPTKEWIMVLFEKNGMSFFTSTNMKQWKRQSHIEGLHECPDFFELPVDGNPGNKKWILHGGSSDYFIGSFDGKSFTPETEKVSYSEGTTPGWGPTLYAALTFEEMPDNRRVQIAWGRIKHEGMPFNQMMLFPTEFSLRTTKNGIRLCSRPIKEIEALHSLTHRWQSLSVMEANKKLSGIKSKSLHIKMNVNLERDKYLHLMYNGNELFNFSTNDLLKEISSWHEQQGIYDIEILIDRTSAEIFLNKGLRYIIKGLKPKKNDDGLEFVSEKYGPVLQHLEVHELRSIWNTE